MGLCKYRKKKDNGKGCVFFKDGFCQRPDMFRCIEYMARVRLTISHSSILDFWKCPFLFLLKDVIGLQVKEEFKNVNIRMGIAFHELLSKGRYRTYFSSDEEKQEMFVNVLADLVKELKLFDLPDMKWEQSFVLDDPDLPQIKGRVDFVSKESSVLGDIKFTSKPDIFLSGGYASDQLTLYAMAFEDIKNFCVCPVRVPSLRQGKDESVEKMSDRLREDILKRPSFYFASYIKPKKRLKNKIGWGEFYIREELPVDRMKVNLIHTALNISFCFNNRNFPQHRCFCNVPFNCDYKDICDTGYIDSNKFYIAGKMEEEFRPIYLSDVYSIIPKLKNFFVLKEYFKDKGEV